MNSFPSARDQLWLRTRAVSIVTLLLICSGTAHGQSSLVGEWRGQTFAAGTTAEITLNLYENGTYARRVTSVSEYGWTLDGERLLIAPLTGTANNEPTYGKAMAIRVTVAGDELIASVAKQSLVLKRVTAAVSESPLLGRWEGLTDLNEPLTQDFTADGRLIISVTVSREAGRYSVDKESINWAEQIPKPERRNSRFKLDQDRLTIFFNPRLPPLELSRHTESTASIN
jgi:hypothetical protein